ncbi:MAG: aminopeptidase P family protein [Nitrospirae bacterium]|nr:aminopeptidase P family protein [Nitrospirota bacterium]
MSIYRERIKKACELMARYELDLVILTKPANMFYLTGDGRLCAYAMVTKDAQVAIGVPNTDVDDVKSAATFDHVMGFEDEVGMIHSIAHFFEKFGIQHGVMGLEYAFLPQPRMGMLIHPHAKPKAVISKDCTPLMSELRLVKDKGEIEQLRTAAKTADAGMKAAVEALRPGITEIQLAAEAEYAMRQAGAEDFYRTYVASGIRTNLAHGVPTTKNIQSSDLVLIDIHPVVNGYAADICRTVCIGQASGKQKDAHELYIRGLENATNKAKAGATVTELEQSMHGVFAAAGHKEHIFGPPIHGIGIEFEEAPLPAGHAFFHGEKAPAPLKAGVVIAIGNCGLYTGPWGVREEDTVVIGEEGPQVLTNYPKKLQPHQ